MTAHGISIFTELDWLDATATLQGDDAATTRIAHLRELVEHELEYARNRDLGYGIVRRRTDAPAGAVLGWWLANDAVTRANRRALGVYVPGDEKEPTP